MIQLQTCLSVTDNSGAIKLQCIRIPGTRRKFARLGDEIVGVVKTALPHLAVKRREVVRAVIVRTKQAQPRKDGSHVRFDDNAVVITDKNHNPIGTRVFGPLAREVKDKGFPNVAALTLHLL
jgi:large subunit ribosomal protein L14